MTIDSRFFLPPLLCPNKLKKEKEKKGGGGAAIVSSILCGV
jgi:hypothetical protein